ncbi:MAG: phosphoglycolate phosphatase [Pseudomonadales bacterium]
MKGDQEAALIKRYAGYLFDLDGTLVDTASDINAALNHALVSAGFPAVDEDLTRHWIGHGARILIEQALERHGRSPESVDALLDRFIDHYEANIAALSQPYPEVVETLELLRERGAKLAVVTNKRTQLTEPLLDALDLTRHFHSIVCGDTAAHPKPAADPALHACRALGLSPDAVLFVGDSETDVACARAAGCPVVCVPGGYNHGIPAAELGADAVIESFRVLV